MDGFVIDQDTVDVLDAADIKGPDGKGLLASLEAEGYDTDDLGSLADERSSRGRRIPPLPPLTDH